MTGLRQRWRPRRRRTVTFCDACGQACDAACRARAARDRQDLRLQLHGPVR